jgi:hypothetical protein
MSSVFEFDDLPTTIKNMSIQDVEQMSESGYSSEIDATEPRKIPKDEKLYEVPLDENFISSSLTTSNTTTLNLGRKVSLDDFEILKLLGRGA